MTFEQKTRATFHQIHMSQTENKSQMDRTGLVNSPEFMGVPAEFFNGKVCLEAGCGSFAPGSQKLLEAGAAKVYAIDLDDRVSEVAPLILKQYPDRFATGVASVLDIPFDAASFDFVMCGGVLHHTSDPQKGLREICRVTKPGGSIFVSVQGEGGLMKAITRVAHQMYEKEAEWKLFIDGLTADQIEDMAGWLAAEMRAQGDLAGADMLAAVISRQFVDQDLILTIFDRVKAPAYNDMRETDFLGVLDDFGFRDRRRIHHYHQFNNVRRFLAPLYHDPKHPLSRMMYGEGILEYFATRSLPAG